MQRYFTNFQKDQVEVLITGDDVHHIKNVMRMKVDDPVYVSNNEQVYYAVIKEINSDSVLLACQYEVHTNSELPINITIAQGLPKLDKFEWVIQKTTELGVSELLPIKSERTIVKLDAKKEAKKLERYNRIAKEASEQSHRVKVPTIKPVMTVKELIKYSEHYEHKLVAYEATTKEDETNLYHTLQEVKQGDHVLLFIGPEGGISEKELNLLVKHDFKIISLGNRILRTETAPIMFMSAVVYELELRG